MQIRDVMCFGHNHASDVLIYVMNEVCYERSDLFNDENELYALRWANYLVFLIIS